MDNWYVPITLLPSAGFFIMATSGVSNALSAEIARLIELDREAGKRIILLKIRQLRLINIALVLLYAGAIFLALSGLIAGLQANFMLAMRTWVEVLICVGIGSVIAALGILIVYAMRAVRIKEAQFRDMR